jgi:hypothetical protein
MTKFEKQLEEKEDYELVEIYSNAPDYQPEFIEQVKAHIVKREISLKNLSSLSEEEIKQLKEKEIKQLKVKPAEQIKNPSKTLEDNTFVLSEINSNILSIKNNVRFFFWLTICSLALSFIVTIMSVA